MPGLGLPIRLVLRPLMLYRLVAGRLVAGRLVGGPLVAGRLRPRLWWSRITCPGGSGARATCCGLLLRASG